MMLSFDDGGLGPSADLKNGNKVPDTLLHASGDAVVQKHGNIAGASGHGDYFNGTAFGAVNDEVRGHGPEANRVRGKVFPCVAHAGSLREGLESVEELAYPAVGGLNVVPGDVFPDVVEV